VERAGSIHHNATWLVAARNLYKGKQP